MLKARHFKNCYTYTGYESEPGIYSTSSRGAIQHLDSGIVDSIHHIGFLVFKPKIIINYNHLEKIDPRILKPTPHHEASFTTISAGADDWEMICEHSIVISYPETILLRKLHQFGNGAVRKAVMDFIKQHKYIDVKALNFDDATWLMTNILGKAE